MHLMIEKGFFLFGAFINLFLIFKIVIRPVLWSTTNTFLCCLLCLNSFHLLVQVFLLKEKSIPLLDDAFLQSLDYMFYDINTSKICSAEYICGFVHGSLTLNVLIGIIFIRLMMIKHAEKIRTGSLDCKDYQARLSIIGVLVSVYILTFFFGVIFNLLLFPLYPYDFVSVKYCRGIPISYSEHEGRRPTILYSANVILQYMANNSFSLKFPPAYARAAKPFS